jgi:hypothetical protein
LRRERHNYSGNTTAAFSIEGCRDPPRFLVILPVTFVMLAGDVWSAKKRGHAATSRTEWIPNRSRQPSRRFLKQREEP